MQELIGALKEIDKYINQFRNQSLCDSDKVIDAFLDLRRLIENVL